MIARRGLLGKAAAMGTALVAAAPRRGMGLPPELRFNVMRDGNEIGHHTITFRQDGDMLLANVVVEIVVRLGPIPLFRYHHGVRETWRGGQFIALDSETNDDGKSFKVHAARFGDQVIVETLTAPRVVLGPDTIPLTHWNILCMRRPLFNPQDGLPVDSTIVPRGEEMVPLADGRLVPAAHYSLGGKVVLDDWYDEARQWVALRTAGRDGSKIEYRLAV